MLYTLGACVGLNRSPFLVFCPFFLSYVELSTLYARGERVRRSAVLFLVYTLCCWLVYWYMLLWRGRPKQVLSCVIAYLGGAVPRVYTERGGGPWL